MEANRNIQEVTTPPSPSSLDQWRRIIALRESSGISIKEFCRERSISPAKYYYWRDRVLGRSPRRQSRAAVQASKGFAAVELGKPVEGLRLEFPSGIIVQASPWAGSGGVLEILKELGGVKDA